MSYNNDDYDYYTSATCDSVGMSGNCGFDCPVFNRGSCDYPPDFDEPQLIEIIETYDFDDAMEILEAYDVTKLSGITIKWE